MTTLSEYLAMLATVILGLYTVYYLYNFASRRYFTGCVDLKGKTVIITGGNSGIGKMTALDLAQRGARVILASCEPRQARDTAVEIRSRTGNAEVVARYLDLGSLRSVRDFARKIVDDEQRLDILINNAGVGKAPPRGAGVTEDNFDFVFGINHLGHFLLTNLLLGRLRETPGGSRVVTVASVLHRVPRRLDLARRDPKGAANGSGSGHGHLYPHLRGYAVSKVASVLFARELGRREAASGVVSVAVHPGTVYSPIWRTHMVAASSLKAILYYVLSPFLWLFLIDVKTGAQTTIHCALHESVAGQSGKYFDNCRVQQPSALARDDELARKLWDVSCEATGIK